MVYLPHINVETQTGIAIREILEVLKLQWQLVARKTEAVM